MTCVFWSSVITTTRVSPRHKQEDHLHCFLWYICCSYQFPVSCYLISLLCSSPVWLTDLWMREWTAGSSLLKGRRIGVVSCMQALLSCNFALFDSLIWIIGPSSLSMLISWQGCPILQSWVWEDCIAFKYLGHLWLCPRGSSRLIAKNTSNKILKLILKWTGSKFVHYRCSLYYHERFLHVQFSLTGQFFPYPFCLSSYRLISTLLRSAHLSVFVTLYCIILGCHICPFLSVSLLHPTSSLYFPLHFCSNVMRLALYFLILCLLYYHIPSILLCIQLNKSSSGL